MKKSIAVLGSTGSIGIQSLDVAEKSDYIVEAVTANSDYKKLEEQIRKFKPKYAALADEKAAKELIVRTKDTNTKVFAGIGGICYCAEETNADTVIDSIVGLAGLRPALSVLESGKNLALANKEALVAGGTLVLNAAKNANKRILPVDSEHSAIFQCLEGKPSNKALKRIILTASGGPFFGKSKEELKNVSAADALKHPTWDMGAKITIDSASMFNKGLELIEAHYLFGLAPEYIDIVVHRESIIHSMIEYNDNSVIAQLGLSDMRIPIQYALTYPERYPSPVGQLNLAQIGKLTFFEPDYEVFDCLNICKKAISLGGLYPAAVNSANEEANRLFREGKIGFNQISELINTVFEKDYSKKDFVLQDIYDTDAQVRQTVLSNI